MKRTRYAALLLTAACLAAGQPLHSQPFNDFIHGGINNIGSRSVVRGYSATEAVAYYGNGLGHFLVIVNQAGQVSGASLLSGYEVCDIRVLGDEVYFCGKKGNCGFIGMANVNDLRASSPNVRYFNLNSNAVSELTRMVAYRVGGVTKVAAVGLYRYSAAGTPSSILPTATLYAWTSVVVECDFAGGVMAHYDVLAVDDTTRREAAYDIVETDHYVAVVTHYHNADEMVVHRCDKAAVLGTFSACAFRYPSLYFEGRMGYRACRTEGDTMAVVGMASATGGQPYEIHMRLFDLQGMSVTSYQGYVFPDKSAHTDVVYMPRHATLVMLQNHSFPPSTCYYPFVYWKPYETLTYNARVLHEAFPEKSYQSLDRLTKDCYVATGGDYWFVKDVSYDSPTSRCYKIYDLKINILSPLPPKPFPQSYSMISLTSGSSGGATGTSDSVGYNCSTP